MLMLVCFEEPMPDVMLWPACMQVSVELCASRVSSAGDADTTPMASPEALAAAHMLFGTPGRMLDMMRR